MLVKIGVCFLQKGWAWAEGGNGDDLAQKGAVSAGCRLFWLEIMKIDNRSNDLCRMQRTGLLNDAAAATTITHHP